MVVSLNLFIYDYGLPLPSNMVWIILAILLCIYAITIIFL